MDSNWEIYNKATYCIITSKAASCGTDQIDSNQSLVMYW